MLLKDSVIGVLGSGAMGSGIAQVAATSGHKVLLCDNNAAALLKSKKDLNNVLQKLVDKQKINPEQQHKIQTNISYVNNISDLAPCDLVIEAIVENLEIKQTVFKEFEKTLSNNCVLASNTSSLSITSIASVCKNPERVIGIHFFNPAPLMPLVEIIPGIATLGNTVTD